MNLSAGIGLIVMITSESMTLANVEPFPTWNTPLMWTGFILFADGIVFSRRGTSWIRSAPAEFALLAAVSIPLWLIFELYNQFISNWYYVGLPEPLALRTLGYGWAFATIWPCIFEGADLVAVCWNTEGSSQSSGTAPSVGPHGRAVDRRLATSVDSFGAASWLSVGAGTVMLTWPLIRPSPYLAAPVFLGFIFLLDPINAWLGAESLGRDFRHGRYDRVRNLVASGFLCGILWECWNYWSHAKWHYTVPILEDLKIFEMPVPGYFGFPAFALECFTMYVFVRALLARHWQHPIARPLSSEPLNA